MKKRLFSFFLVIICVCAFSLSAFAKSIDDVTADDAAQITANPYLWYAQNQMLGVEKGTGVTLVCPNGDYKILYTGGTLVTCPYDGEALVLADAGGVKVKKIPDGIGRKDLGYNDNEGTPTIGVDGLPPLTFKMSLNGFSTDFGGEFLYGTPMGSFSNGSYSITSTYNFTAFHSSDNATEYPGGWISFYFDAPYTAVYEVPDVSCSVKIVSKDNKGNIFSEYDDANRIKVDVFFEDKQPSRPSRLRESMLSGVAKKFKSNNRVLIVKGDRYFFNFYFRSYTYLGTSSGHSVYYDVAFNFPAPTVTVRDIRSDVTINKQTNITINNNTWNGNIYTDNSTNLTYIYPQYTTINENNETVTNISNNPIIYNSETKQYYTYDSVTNNYYYITYEQQPATPTPSPNPTPSPSPNPSEPTPTSTPGGGTIITPGGDNPGSTSTPESGSKGDGGSSGWNPFKWLADLLKDIVETILKGLWKLLTSIFGFILWLLSLLFKLFPWIPNSGILALCAGVVVVTVIRIIKFITGR